MKSLPYWFIGLGTLFALAGMVLGIYMGMSEDHSLIDAHAHNNLIGYVTMIIYGVYYRLVPAATGKLLATFHFWVALAGAATFGIGLALTLQGFASQNSPDAPKVNGDESSAVCGIARSSSDLMRP